MNTIANATMKEIRLMYDLTGEKLGELVGCSRQTIGMIEKGEQIPNVFLAQRISKVLHTTVEQLFPLSPQDPVYTMLRLHDPLSAALLEHEQLKE